MTSPTKVAPIVETKSEAAKLGLIMADMFEQVGAKPVGIESNERGAVLTWSSGSRLRIDVGASRMALTVVQHARVADGEWKHDWQEKFCTAKAPKAKAAFVGRVADGLKRADFQAAGWTAEQDEGFKVMRQAAAGIGDVTVKKDGDVSKRNDPGIKVQFCGSYEVELTCDSRLQGFWFDYHWTIDRGRQSKKRFLPGDNIKEWLTSMVLAVDKTELR